MTSTMDSGKRLDAALKAKARECQKSPDKRHDWKRHGYWPSVWDVCKHCEVTVFL